MRTLTIFLIFFNASTILNFSKIVIFNKICFTKKKPKTAGQLRPVAHRALNDPVVRHLRQEKVKYALRVEEAARLQAHTIFSFLLF